MIRPDALAVPVSPTAAKILLHRSPWAHIRSMLTQSGAPTSAIEELRRTWAGMETIATLAEQYGAAPAAVAPTDDLDAAGDEAPMTAVEAAEVLSVGDKRVKQLAKDGTLARVTVPGDRRVYVDPVSVRELASRRANRDAA